MIDKFKMYEHVGLIICCLLMCHTLDRVFGAAKAVYWQGLHCVVCHCLLSVVCLCSILLNAEHQARKRHGPFWRLCHDSAGVWSAGHSDSEWTPEPLRHRVWLNCCPTAPQSVHNLCHFALIVKMKLREIKVVIKIARDVYSFE